MLFICHVADIPLGTVIGFPAGSRQAATVQARGKRRARTATTCFPAYAASKEHAAELCAPTLRR
jgi:hypothetical protein